MRVRDLFGVALKLGLSRRSIAKIVALDLSRTAVELLAVVTLLPTIQYLQAGGNLGMLLEKHEAWRTLAAAYALVGLEPTLGPLLLTTYLFIVIRQALGYAYSVAVAKLKSGTSSQLRMRMFARFLSMTLDRQERLSSGGFGSGVIQETDAAANTIMQLIRLLGFGGLLVAYVITMLYVSIAMTVLSIVFGIAVAFALRGMLQKSHHAGVQLTDVNEGLMRFLSERIGMLRLIRMSGMEAGELGAFNRMAVEQRDRLIDIDRFAARLSVMIEPVFAAVAFAFLYVGFAKFGLALDTIALFMIVMLRLVPLGRDILAARQVVLAFEPQMVSLHRRLDDLSDAREPSAGTRRLEGVHQSIRFDNVTFCYPGIQTPALDRMSVEIPAQTLTALVGPSGGGKSTLVDLLPRLRIPQSGTIQFDGRPIEEFSLASLRAATAFAPQLPQFFDLPIAEHIRFGRPAATDAEVEAVARDVGALRFIEALPAGFATRLGERGLHLSGGQRQRIDLARALIKKSPLLVLDEPTAALDAESEAAFRAILEKLKERRSQTIILIGHRLSTVSIADRIVVMQAGRVVTAGTPAELMDRPGWYREAWRAYSTGAERAEPVI